MCIRDRCETIRRDSASIGIIMLSAKTLETDKIKGLSIGADDYMTKPFSVSELLARVEALVRRVGRQGASSAAPEPDGRMVSGVFAVSYTHLDVYKRQGRGRRVAGRAIFRSGPAAAGDGILIPERGLF